MLALLIPGVGMGGGESSGTPPAVVATSTGGWGYFNSYEIELNRRRAAEKRRKKLLEELEEIQDEASKEIAVIMHDDDAEKEQEQEKARLRALVKTVSKEQIEREFGERVAIAYNRALEKATYSALEALVREAKRAEDEELLMLAIITAMH